VIDASHVHRQPGFSLRLDWGSTGATAVSAGCDVAVVVDVLSFTTTLTVAADRGTIVFPYPWRDESAVRYADERDAVLAVGRSQAIDGQVSLSSATIRAADDLPRLVLPSPNGSAISFQLAQSANSVIGVSLRNRRAAADWLLRRRESTPDLAVAIIAAGERWPDGSLRPAVEDLWGAGALVTALRAEGWAGISPEAEAAGAGYDAVAGAVSEALHRCASGLELISAGFSDDVVTAAQLDQSMAVPLLDEDVFRSTRGFSKAPGGRVPRGSAG
jgi:2-phosphosulfolactate phosphatase